MDCHTGSPPSEKPSWEVVNHCADCGRPMTKAEGGTVFTVCDACWIGKQNAESRAAMSEDKPMETAWLLEKKIEGRPHWIGVIDGLLDWTPEANRALRLSRREDGDSLSEICEDAEGVIEHGWM